MRQKSFVPKSWRPLVKRIDPKGQRQVITADDRAAFAQYLDFRVHKDKSLTIGGMLEALGNCPFTLADVKRVVGFDCNVPSGSTIFRAVLASLIKKGCLLDNKVGRGKKPGADPCEWMIDLDIDELDDIDESDDIEASDLETDADFVGDAVESIADQAMELPN